MPETAVRHKDNDNPTASHEGIKRMDADTPHAPDGAAVNDQGVRVDSDTNDDPKSGGTPVHRAPTEDSSQS
jgi:hypothetical protein